MQISLKSLKPAKRAAKKLREALAEAGVKLSLPACQDLVARLYGYSHWRELAATITAISPRKIQPLPQAVLWTARAAGLIREAAPALSARAAAIADSVSPFHAPAAFETLMTIDVTELAAEKVSFRMLFEGHSSPLDLALTVHRTGLIDISLTVLNSRRTDRSIAFEAILGALGIDVAGDDYFRLHAASFCRYVDPTLAHDAERAKRVAEARGRAKGWLDPIALRAASIGFANTEDYGLLARKDKRDATLLAVTARWPAFLSDAFLALRDKQISTDPTSGDAEGALAALLLIDSGTDEFKALVRQLDACPPDWHMEPKRYCHGLLRLPQALWPSSREECVAFSAVNYHLSEATGPLNPKRDAMVDALLRSITDLADGEWLWRNARFRLDVATHRAVAMLEDEGIEMRGESEVFADAQKRLLDSLNDFSECLAWRLLKPALARRNPTVKALVEGSITNWNKRSHKGPVLPPDDLEAFAASLLSPDVGIEDLMAFRRVEAEKIKPAHASGDAAARGWLAIYRPYLLAELRDLDLDGLADLTLKHLAAINHTIPDAA